MSTLPTYPPASFEAGTTVAFTQAAASTTLGTVSPATGWSLSWLLRKTDGTDEANVLATDDGTLWTVTFSAALSGALAAGECRAGRRATKALETVTLAQSTVTVTPNLSLGGVDVRTWEERTLEAVEAALSGTVDGALKMYMIAGRQVMTYTPDELMKLRARLQATIAAQRTGIFGRPVRQTVVWR